MEKAIEHFKKLIECKQFVITGSYAFRELGLTESVKDLDIIVVKPTEESLSVLEKLRVPPLGNYPPSKTQIPVMFGDIRVDVIILTHTVDAIELANGLSISKPRGIIAAKKGYTRLKDLMQLKTIAEMFYTKSDLEAFIRREQQKVIKTEEPKVDPFKTKRKK